MILPPGHAQRLGAGRALSHREKWMVRGVLGVVVAIAVALAASFVVGGQSSRRGCIYATIPAATGAQQVNECGDTARSTCLSVSTPGAFTAQAADAVAAECRKAGLPVSR